MTSPWAIFGDDETASQRLAEWLLVETVADIRRRTSAGATRYDQLGIAGVLRRMLLDRRPVLHVARRRLDLPRLTFTYAVPHPPPEPPATAALGPALHFARLRPEPTAEIRSAGLEEFLKVPCAWHWGEARTVREVIRYFAHAHGGVHLYSPESDFERMVQRISAALPFAADGWIGALADLGVIVADALEPLAGRIASDPHPIIEIPPEIRAVVDRRSESEGRRLVWSEVRDLLSVAGVDTVEDLITALGEYRADPPLPHEQVDER